MNRVDPWIALATAIALGFLYQLGFQESYSHDGPGLATRWARARASSVPFHHTLYYPACALLDAIVEPRDPAGVPKLLSVVSGGLGVGLTYLLARGLGARRGPSLLATALVASTPALWIYATSVEVHALHFAMVALAAVVTLAAPWRLFAPALALTCLAVATIVPSHGSGFVLGPGWVLLVGFASRRRGAPLSAARLLLVVGPALLATMLASLALGHLHATGEASLRIGERATFVGTFHRAWQPWETLWRGWILPLGALPLAAALGARRMGRAALAPAVLFLSSFAFFYWYGPHEDGGFALGSLPFLAVLAGAALARAGGRAVAATAAAIALHAAIAAYTVERLDRGFRADERVEVVSALAQGPAGLLSLGSPVPAVDLWLPAVRERDVVDEVAFFARAGRPPGDFVRDALPFAQAMRREGALLVDLSHRAPSRAEHPGTAALAPYFEGLIEALRADGEAVLFDHPVWPMLVLPERSE